MSVAHYGGFPSDARRRSDCVMSYPHFTATTPTSMGKNYTANTLTPGKKEKKNYFIYLV